MAKKPEPPIDEAEKARLEQIQAYEMQLKAAKRLITLKKARDSLIDFARMSMPDPSDPDDTELSRYKAAAHHEIIAGALERVESGEWLRLIITIPPRHGKSELASKRFPAWFMGRNPYMSIILASHTASLAEDFGKEVREQMKSPFYQQVFPGCRLRRGGAASDRIQTSEGGTAVFVGKGGTLTGRGADCLLIDDIVSDREEADSPTQRNKMWSWFTQVAMSRLMSVGGRVVIIMTRWHEDDIVGRLIDPDNPYYNPEEAKNWRVLHLPAIAGKNDVLGRKEGDALWPDRFSADYLLSARRLDPRGFEALYQGNPAPEEGNFFKAEHIKTYLPHDLPRELRYYVASDHAVSTEQNRDLTACVVVGVDQNGTMWVLPEIFWRQADTDDVVDGMIDLMRSYHPLYWWAEKGHISKSIGPFLRKRMDEERVYVNLVEVVPAKDKVTRAQAIQARMAMGKVRFPGFAYWWPEAQQELLKFPHGKHDDFVDALAHLGRELTRINSASPTAPRTDNVPKPGTFGWVKWKATIERRLKAAQDTGGF